MTKQRFTSADVAGEAACLRTRVLGMRLANLYDIDAKTYLLKMARSGEDGEKIFILLESGTRFHTTQFVKERSEAPSNFTLKLRKHLRTRRLDSVRQLGVDRVVDFTFGSGEACYHLILELYAAGNLILTDANYQILTLLRSHRDDAKGLATMAAHAYPIHSIRLRTPLAPEQLAAAMGVADEKATLRGALAEEALLAGVRSWEAWLDVCETSAPEGFIATRPAGGDRRSKLMHAAKASEEAASRSPVDGRTPGGAEGQASGAAAADGEEDVIYEGFEPLELAQHAKRPMLRLPTFDAALDEYFSKVEGQKVAAARAAQERAVLGKVDRIRSENAARAEALEREAADAELKAELLELNAEAVDGAIQAVLAALASSLTWAEVKRLIKDEREAGNPVAALIHALALERNSITLALSNWAEEEEGDDDAQTRAATLVEVDLDLNAHANARRWHGDRKARTAKQAKTLDANTRALKVAEKKAQAQLTKVRAVATVQHVRKPFWFEKFNWFITSENYLVVSGRDAQQNELLVKRYLRAGDLYVHADLHGAATIVLRNSDPSRSVPPLSIAQAGQACVCRSQAWDAKIVTSAWWVHAHQVSKSAPSGEYLPTGSFMVRGAKQFLPPHPLVMGFALLFKLDESCIGAHLGERAPRGTDDDAAGLGPGQSALDAYMDGAADPLRRHYQRYGLAMAQPRGAETAAADAAAGQVADAGVDDGSAGNGVAGEAGAPAPRHLSAHQRRLLKKGLPLDAAPAAPDAGGAAVDSAQADAAAVDAARVAERERRAAKAQAQEAASAAAAAARGKRSKVKKAREKYGDQDEEDRELLLDFLGSAGGSKSKQERKEARKARKRADGDAGADAGRQPTAEELAAAGARLVVGPAQESQDEAAEVAALLASENVTLVQEDERDRLGPLDALTGAPLPDDVLLFSLPVCAPYSALQSYKLKVKLTPGTQKKGKGGRQAMELLKRSPDLTLREKELLAAVPEAEVVAAMVGNVKLSMPGLTKLKTAERRGKAKGKG
ncbi:hypothetical protein WJX81_001363 [Elliptochloris bilobata]|uniref:NFACT RNA-binding domain-containing protein n=1 Tax=Elliptochloris bilobata TaxID=381761 RepID=A0AAW1RU22_9CHLO